ncbi:MAG: PorT family protein, partial [Bacteroidales bacterium]|nr:PorT family protein [Bacteroidales bacterium]
RIENKDWKYNPKIIRCKFGDSDTIKEIHVDNLVEFGVPLLMRYVVAEVNVDRSSSEIKKISEQRLPEWRKERISLKVLVEGNGTLFYYEDGIVQRFFSQKNGGEIEQLVYKIYKHPRAITGEIIKVHNNHFRQQLKTGYFMESYTDQSIANIRYTKSHLIRYFTKYNESVGVEYLDYVTKKQENLVDIQIFAGIDHTDYKFTFNEESRYNREFGSKYNFTFGINVEYILNFNKNKWSIFAAPCYQQYNNELNNSKISYQSIEIPIGLCYYMFLNKNSRIFLNAATVTDFPINSVFTHNVFGDYDVNSKMNLMAGCGYSFGRINAGLKYYTNRRLLRNYSFASTQYNKMSAYVGYRIL